MTITRNVAGLELKIELTNEELQNIVTECARITFSPGAKVQELPKVTLPKTTQKRKPYRTGIIQANGDEVIRMYASGMSFSEIAKHFGTSDETVGRYLRVSGVHIRSIKEATRIRFSRKKVA